MAGYGVREDDIALVLGLAPKTLRKHFRPELDTGHIKANVKVAESLFRKATGPGREAVTAAIFWLKTRAGWTEPKQPEPLGKKAFAERQATSAGEGTSWDELINPSAARAAPFIRGR
jgi:hypothetical protein